MATVPQEEEEEEEEEGGWGLRRRESLGPSSAEAAATEGGDDVAVCGAFGRRPFRGREGRRIAAAKGGKENYQYPIMSKGREIQMI